MPGACTLRILVSTGNWSTATLSQARAYLAATTVGTEVLFAGGWLGGSSSTRSDRVEIYDDSTGTWSIASLSVPRDGIAAAAVGTKALFAGGANSSGVASDRVDIYDASTSTWSTATLSAPRWTIAATNVGNLILFAGGDGGSGYSDVVDIYDDCTGTWTTSTLPEARGYLAAASLGGEAYFGGGRASGGYSDVVDIYRATGVGTNYCSVNPNSSGGPALIFACGSGSIADDDLTLTAAPLPASETYLFFHAQDQVELPFGNGFLCAAGGIIRLGPPMAAISGVATRVLDVPVEVGVPGVRNFQCWFRDPAAGGAFYNTSDAYSISFVP